MQVRPTAQPAPGKTASWISACSRMEGSSGSGGSSVAGYLDVDVAVGTAGGVHTAMSRTGTPDLSSHCSWPTRASQLPGWPRSAPLHAVTAPQQWHGHRCALCGRLGTVTSTAAQQCRSRCLLHTWVPAAGLQQQGCADMPPYRPLPLQSAPVRPSKAPDAGVSSGSASAAPPPPPPSGDKPAHDVVAGAMARAASQSTIHPLDTMKVRMQAGGLSGALLSSGGGIGCQTLCCDGALPAARMVCTQRSACLIREPA
jgi:hypothetical protein